MELCACPALHPAAGLRPCRSTRASRRVALAASVAPILVPAAWVTWPAALAALASLPAALAALAPLPAALDALASLPAALTALASLPAALTALVSLPAALAALVSLPAAPGPLLAARSAGLPVPFSASGPCVFGAFRLLLSLFLCVLAALGFFPALALRREATQQGYQDQGK